MRRRMMLFLAVALLAVGGGYAVFRLVLFEDLPKVTPPSEPPRTPDLPPPKLQEPPRVPVMPEAGPVRGVEVVASRGVVERQTSDQKWTPIARGDRLGPEESIKTGQDGSARLKVGEKSEVELTARSELRVREISETVDRFRLVRGRIGVDYNEAGGRRLKIESEDGRAVAESPSGKFTVLNSSGIVSVATSSGEVKLSAGDREVKVAPGTLSKVLPGGAPSAVEPIPVAVMLRVASPQKQLVRERATTVTGRTDVGARVQVNDVQAAVDAKGFFSAQIPLKPGKNRIVVTSEDAGGNVKTSELPPVTMDAEAPVEDLNIHWKNKDKPG
jgi:hypothetical protein